MNCRKILYMTFASAFALVGCKEDELNVPEAGYMQYEVQLFNEIVQAPSTRVNDEGFCDGDGVGVYVVNYENGEPGTLKTDGNQADNVKFVYSEADGKWTPAYPIYYKDKNTHVDIYGYYPYSAPTSIEAYQFEVQKDQSTDAADGKIGGYEASDFLWGKAADITPSASRVSLQFMHRMAGIMVELSEGTGFAEGEFALLEKEVLVANTIRKAEINLQTGVVSPVGDVPATGIVPYKKEGKFRAVVVPQSVAASSPLFSITVDGIPYVFRKSEQFTYVAGKLHKFTIEISKKSQGGLEFKLLGESITAWEADNISHDASAREYIVVECPEGGKLEETIVALGKDYTKIKNLKVTGKINGSDLSFMNYKMPILQSINLGDAEILGGLINNYSFQDKTSLVRFIFPKNTTRIGKQAFENTNLTGSLIIPEGVTEIGFKAFSSCSGLSGTLTLSQSLKIIDDRAFYECSNLIGNLRIPDSVEIIGEYAFSGCSNLTGNLIIPENIKNLKSWAFYECSGFTGSLTIPSGITKIAENCFSSCSGLNGQLILPKNLIEIGSGAFGACSFRGPLNLPEGLSVIGEYAFSGNKFSGNLILPQSLAIIKDCAFNRCLRLTGTVEIPENIISVAPETFADCSQLEGVILHKDIESIGSGAFRNCFQLNSITCKAQTPPYVAADAFNGVAKDNFTVEVPEASVPSYSTAPVWKEFKRFAANRDFSISRSLFRALNASVSKTLVLRVPSGEQWSVESAPDWVTVSPTNGTGKTEVTVTVNELPQGAGCREGKVTFLLDGKDYRSSTTVEQYDYQYGDGDVVTVQSASRGSGVNLVFMGDCFDAKDIYDGKYYDGVMEAIGHFFDVEPYKTYRDYFNVYMIFGLSYDSGVGDVNTIREAKFGSAYSLGGIAPDQSVCFEYACKAPIDGNVSNTLITLILNTADYGGITYMWGDGSAIACCPMSEDVYPYDFRGLVQHEAGGHGFGKLGDEYIYKNSFIQTCLSCFSAFNDAKSRGWYDNLSLSGNMYEVPWSHLIFDPQYSNAVDIYEGGFTHMRGVFRSESNSCMNNNIPYFSAISRESIVKRIKKYAGESYSFDEFKRNDVVIPASQTKAMLPGQTYYQSARQNNPVYMGEKPDFRK